MNLLSRVNHWTSEPDSALIGPHNLRYPLIGGSAGLKQQLVSERRRPPIFSLNVSTPVCVRPLNSHDPSDDASCQILLNEIFFPDIHYIRGHDSMLLQVFVV